MAGESGQDRPVWEKYLSEQDRAHVGTRQPRAPRWGERPALLYVDLYRWVFGDEPQPLMEAVKDWPGSCGLAGWNAIPHLQRLLTAAREAGIPVIYTTGLDEDNISHWAKGSDRDRDRRDPAMEDRERRKNEIIDEVAPLPGELVVRKASPSGFWGTPLLGHLVSLGVDTLIVGGESTSGCVRASVVDGCTNRFHMIVVEECVFDRHEAPHAIDLFTMQQKYADLVSLDDALEYLEDFKTRSRAVGEPTSVGR